MRQHSGKIQVMIPRSHMVAPAGKRPSSVTYQTQFWPLESVQEKLS